jgi:hypothetical protein
LTYKIFWRKSCYFSDIDYFMPLILFLLSLSIFASSDFSTPSYKSLYITDGDKDVILLKVEQVGGIACHTGRKGCFFNTLIDNNWQITSEILKDPKQIYE